MSNPFQLIKPNNDVPIIGQPYRIANWWPSVLMNCNCAGKHPMLLAGLQSPASCPGCGNTYAIHQMAQDPAGNIGVMVVQVVVKRTPSAEDATGSPSTN